MSNRWMIALCTSGGNLFSALFITKQGLESGLLSSVITATLILVILRKSGRDLN